MRVDERVSPEAPARPSSVPRPGTRIASSVVRSHQLIRRSKLSTVFFRLKLQLQSPVLHPTACQLLSHALLSYSATHHEQSYQQNIVSDEGNPAWQTSLAPQLTLSSASRLPVVQSAEDQVRRRSGPRVDDRLSQGKSIQRTNRRVVSIIIRPGHEM